eukprot:CAMPEP_0183708972 /NCGR_PEP_ID=MMETSP0737-20130205/5122_1 /TAXON_ID=385413 /ORGANISM="Thalassiosira miniscula, Strain CCMP1093" /LENGTH=293 /DNA_ID=CAMNT_0025936951 /DNA_START=279 /DNA_END=1160 /DNA_ORIENTATION=+
MNFTFALRVVLAMIGMANSKVQGKLRHSNEITDIGILSSSNRTAVSSSSTSRTLANGPCNSFFFCTNGMVQNGLQPQGTTCAAYCNGRCCAGQNACDDFSGLVCRDRKSCMGDDSCRGANVDLVAKSCRGNGACLHAGAGYGTIKLMDQSCIGNGACHYMAFAGEVQEVNQGCNADNACNGAAKNNANGIAMIRSACNGVGSCTYLAGSENVGGGYDGGGDQISMEECCNSVGSCANSFTLPEECNADAPAPAPAPGPTPSGCSTYTSKGDCQSNFCTWSGKGKNARCVDEPI